MPGAAVQSEVVQQAGVEEGPDVGAVQELAGLPGVQGQGGGAGGEREPFGEAGGELFRGDVTALFGPGGVGGQDGGVDGDPVEGESAVEFGRVEPGLRLGESFPALGGGVEGVAEQQGLFGGEEEVGVRVRPGSRRRSARKSAVRRAESATRPTSSVPSGRPVSRLSSAATVTASTVGAVAGRPSREGAPKRCQPVADQ